MRARIRVSTKSASTLKEVSGEVWIMMTKRAAASLKQLTPGYMRFSVIAFFVIPATSRA